MVSDAPNWVVPVILLPVPDCAMRGVLCPGVLVCGDYIILEPDVVPSWCVVCAHKWVAPVILLPVPYCAIHEVQCGASWCPGVWQLGHPGI